MSIRLLKAALVGFVALGALLYAVQNIVNLGAMEATIAQVAGMAHHDAYPAHMGPPFQHVVLIRAIMAVILAAEFATGILAAKGAWALFVMRRAPAAGFNAAKTPALLGCGMAMIVWFGLFQVLGGAYFQMWQTEIGRGSLETAAQLTTAAGLILLFVNMTDT